MGLVRVDPRITADYARRAQDILLDVFQVHVKFCQGQIRYNALNRLGKDIGPTQTSDWEAFVNREQYLLRRRYVLRPCMRCARLAKDQEI